MSEEKWAFIVNPVAGNRFGNSMTGVIEEMMARHDIIGRIALTGYPGHATELSSAFADEGFRFIIAVGGDGTFNEVASALINKKDVTTGIIPAGTGNDYCKIPGFPDRFGENEWEIFFRKNIISQDAGTVNGRLFFNGMGLGFDAEVASRNYTSEGKVRGGGTGKYIWHIVVTLLFFRGKKWSSAPMASVTGPVVS
jgi:diacylglycerol kinase family enzyme